MGPFRKKCEPIPSKTDTRIQSLDYWKFWLHLLTISTSQWSMKKLKRIHSLGPLFSRYRIFKKFPTKSFFSNFVHIKTSSRLGCGHNFRIFAGNFLQIRYLEIKTLREWILFSFFIPHGDLLMAKGEKANPGICFFFLAGSIGIRFFLLPYGHK
jgi:hypothetical protein